MVCKEANAYATIDNLAFSNFYQPQWACRTRVTRFELQKCRGPLDEDTISFYLVAVQLFVANY